MESSQIYKNLTVIEFTQVLQNIGDPSDEQADLVDYLNVPWGGVRTSTLRDIILSHSNGTYAKVPNPIQNWGTPGEHLPNLRDTDGYTAFTQGIQLSEDETRFLLPCVDTSGNEKNDCDESTISQGYTKVSLRIRFNNACSLNSLWSERKGKNYVNLMLADTVQIKSGCYSCHLTFTNERTSESIYVTDILHWSWSGNRAIFATESSSTQINSIFLAGDLILVSKTDFGTEMKDNLAMAYGTSIIKHSIGQSGKILCSLLCNSIFISSVNSF